MANERSAAVIAGVLGIAAAVIGGLIGGYFLLKSTVNSNSGKPTNTGNSIITPQAPSPTNPCRTSEPSIGYPSNGTPENPPPSTILAEPTTVAPAPPATTTVYLADLSPISGYARSGSSTIGGNKVNYPKSIYFNFNSYQPKTDPSIYSISAGAQTFTATLGIDNQASQELAFQYSVYVDDAYRASYSVGLYDTQEISINVAGHFTPETGSRSNFPTWQ